MSSLEFLQGEMEHRLAELETYVSKIESTNYTKADLLYVQEVFNEALFLGEKLVELHSEKITDAGLYTLRNSIRTVERLLERVK